MVFSPLLPAPLLATDGLFLPTCTSFPEVESYRQQGEWCSRLAVGNNTFITIAVDKELFFHTLVS